MLSVDIEPLRSEHAVLLYPGLADPRLDVFLPSEPFVSLCALTEEFRRLERGCPSGDELWLNWVLFSKGAAVGTLQATVQKDGVALIAYKVLFEHQRKGYGTAGVRWLVERLFEMPSVRLVRAEIDTRNTPSIRLVESVGFRRVRRVENADWFKGHSSDELVYERARPELSLRG